jgi:hypothetical protein
MPFGKNPNELQSTTDPKLKPMNTMRGANVNQLLEEDAKLKEEKTSVPEPKEKATGTK